MREAAWVNPGKLFSLVLTNSCGLTPTWIKTIETLSPRLRIKPKARLAAIGEMITGIAHESGNALARAQAALELLEEPPTPSAED